jgi:DNA-binding transcriptional MerR regulator
MSPANPEDARYTLTELADLAGVTRRTVRYYLAQGLLPAVGASGPGAKYDDAHLARLRLIRRLQAQHLPLADIRRQLESIDDATVQTLVAEPEPAAPPDSALDYVQRLMAPAHAVAESSPALASRAYLMAEPAPPAPAVSAPSPDVAMRLERSQWERIELAPDIELHVRRPLARHTAKQVDRLISIARDLFEKENPS